MKEELDKIEEALRRIENRHGFEADAYEPMTTSHDAMGALRLLQDLRADIEEGLKLLAIKRLQDSMDDGGFDESSYTAGL